MVSQESLYGSLPLSGMSRLEEREDLVRVDMEEIQQMIDSAMKNGPLIPDFNLYSNESSLSLLEHIDRF